MTRANICVAARRLPFLPLLLAVLMALSLVVQAGLARADDGGTLRSLIEGQIAGGIAQINLLIGTIIASLQDGAVSWLYYADRVYQLPLGVIGIAIGVVLLPDLARRLRAEDAGGALWSQNRALEFSMLLTLPATAALIAIPGPIVETLFERGAFDAADTLNTQMALAAFAIGLPAFVLIKVFSPGFFARENTATPMRFAAAGIAVNITGSLILFYQVGFIGIAIATSMAAWVNAGLLWLRLRSLSHYTADQRLIARLPKIILASALMGAALWAAATVAWAGPGDEDESVERPPGPALLTITSADAGEDGEVSLPISASALKEMAGSPSVMAITVRAATDETTPFYIKCDFGTLGDCGRRRFNAESQATDALIELDFSGQPAPSASGTISINSDITGIGRPIQIFAVRIRPAG